MVDELSLATTEAIKGELEKRYDSGVVMLNRTRSSEQAEVDFRFWGNTFEVVGLLRAAVRHIEREAGEVFGDEEEGR